MVTISSRAVGLKRHGKEWRWEDRTAGFRRAKTQKPDWIVHKNKLDVRPSWRKSWLTEMNLWEGLTLLLRGRLTAYREAMLSRFLDEFKDSPFAWLNERVSGFSCYRATSCRWLVERNRGTEPGLRTCFWENVKFPAISKSSFGYSRVGGEDSTGLELDGKSLYLLPCSVPAPDFSSTQLGAIGWNSGLMPPDRVVFLKTWWFSLAPIWLRRPLAPPAHRFIRSKFPPGWHELCGARFDWYSGRGGAAIVWNHDHPLVKRVAPQHGSGANRLLKNRSTRYRTGMNYSEIPVRQRHGFSSVSAKIPSRYGTAYWNEIQGSFLNCCAFFSLAKGK